VIRNLLVSADLSVPITGLKCQPCVILDIRSQESRRMTVFYLLDAYLIKQQEMLLKMGGVIEG